MSEDALVEELEAFARYCERRNAAIRAQQSRR